MALTLEQAIARVPFLKDAKDIKSTELTGGITNKNYKLETGGKAYMLRITGENTDLLGIQREIEHASNLAAGRLGIAPEVLYFIEPEGYLVTRFIDGKRIPPEEMVKPDNIRRVVRKLRMYHTRAPEVKGEFNVFRRVEHLIDISKQHGSKFPFDFDWIMGKMKDVETALLKDPYVPTPCHCDLLNLNFLDENVAGEIGEVKILDWEYAGMGDIFFDLGNFCHHHRFNDDLVNVLLGQTIGAGAEYRLHALGEVVRRERRHRSSLSGCRVVLQQDQHLAGDLFNDLIQGCVVDLSHAWRVLILVRYRAKRRSICMILSTRRAWRPPPNDVSNQVLTICCARLAPISPAPRVSTLASLCSRLLTADDWS